MSLYPAKSESNLDYIIEDDKKFSDFDSLENLSNFKNYVFQAQNGDELCKNCEKLQKQVGISEKIVCKHNWKSAEFNDFTLPAQGRSSDYCKKWISYGCGNTKQHPSGLHYAKHQQKSCKKAECPLCFQDWINQLAYRSMRRFIEFAKDKPFNFRHVILSPPQKVALEMSDKALQKYLKKTLVALNVETCAVVYHPFRFLDKKKSMPYASPHFHLIAYGRITNTTIFNKETGWFVKNKGDLKNEKGIRNCMAYLLSHTGIKKRKHTIKYLGDISYRKLKVEKETKDNSCPHCNLPLTIYRIVKSTKSPPPAIDHDGLWDPSCFEIVIIDDDDQEPRIPFYEINDDGNLYERQLYSFTEILSVKTARKAISDRNYALSQAQYPTALQCHSIQEFN